VQELELVEIHRVAEHAVAEVREQPEGDEVEGEEVTRSRRLGAGRRAGSATARLAAEQPDGHAVQPQLALHREAGGVVEAEALGSSSRARPAARRVDLGEPGGEERRATPRLLGGTHAEQREIPVGALRPAREQGLEDLRPAPGHAHALAEQDPMQPRSGGAGMDGRRAARRPARPPVLPPSPSSVPWRNARELHPQAVGRAGDPARGESR
jgi:hypothetical protein